MVASPTVGPWLSRNLFGVVKSQPFHMLAREAASIPCLSWVTSEKVEFSEAQSSITKDLRANALVPVSDFSEDEETALAGDAIDSEVHHTCCSRLCVEIEASVDGVVTWSRGKIGSRDA